MLKIAQFTQTLHNNNKEKTMTKKDHILTLIFIFVVTFGYFGWFMAELDNQMLQQELASLKYNSTEIRGLHKWAQLNQLQKS